jgi:glycosyltransferase involved in cell wall biosynthesis
MTVRVIYMPLEPYPERYTELLTAWTTSRFSADPEIKLETVVGTPIGSTGIQTGQVLDAHGRSHWSLTQMAALIARLRVEPATKRTVVYFDDMFTPGYEALPYLLDQLPKEQRPKIVARNHAQSVDPDDFVFKMRHWMRHYEEIVYRTASSIVCASTVHKELMEVANLPGDVRVLGLPYDRDDVRARVPQLPEKRQQVIYSSRFDAEKQPHFFLDVVRAVHIQRPDIGFVVCTGGEQVRSNDPSAVERLYGSAVRIVTRATKAAYYGELAASRVQLNTARQDFISYTAIEASTFGVPTLAPAFRSFPETLRNRAQTLYVPWSVEEAADKLIKLVDGGDDPTETAVLADEQHGCLDRIAALFKELCA